ncbi:hypothetical protein A6U88_32945 [Agrobacterium sp. B131/95]|nr:hypothetical protein A6U88_32945 [Agrobacterium sp. B131/95]
MIFREALVTCPARLLVPQINDGEFMLSSMGAWFSSGRSSEVGFAEIASKMGITVGRTDHSVSSLLRAL